MIEEIQKIAMLDLAKDIYQRAFSGNKVKPEDFTSCLQVASQLMINATLKEILSELKKGHDAEAKRAFANNIFGGLRK